MEKKIPNEKVERQIHLLTEAFPNALVTNYEGLIVTINLPDENDRHVVSAAIKCNANVIVTYNRKDFPEDYLATFGLSVIDPDTFMADIIDLDPQKCCEAFKEMVLSKNKPEYTEKEYLEIFKSTNLDQSALELEKFI